MNERPPHRLLIRGVNWLGDAVITTPALVRLREALPSTRIALLTRAKLADLWVSHPAIDEVISVEPGESVWAVGRKLRGAGFDTALVLPNSPRSALEVWLAGIPRRIGYKRPWRNWCLTRAIPTRPGHVKMRKRSISEIKRLSRKQPPGVATIPPGTDHPAFSSRAHQMHEYLHLAGTLGASEKPLGPTLAVTDPEIDAALAKFRIPRGTVWLGLNAGAEYGPAKRWPTDRFIAAATAACDRADCGCLIFGGPADVRLAGEIAGQIRRPQSLLRSVAGQTSLRELMTLLKHCRALLTNDTGPMHLAAALGVPVIVPFGSTSPELTGPGLPGDPRHRLIRSNAPCSPCFLRACPIDFRCMNGIRVERVVDVVVETLLEH